MDTGYRCGGEEKATPAASELIAHPPAPADAEKVTMPTPVAINVYDLNEYNDYAYAFGVGIFHSGLEVHGREYSFGGHDYASSGIFATEPREAPPPAKFRCSEIVGYTDMTAQEVEDRVAELDRFYHGNTYHLLERNCNSFVEELCLELTGKMPPPWVNRLARMAVVANSCAPCVLPASIRAVASTPSVPPPPSNGEANSADEADDDEAPLLNFPGQASMSKRAR